MIPDVIISPSIGFQCNKVASQGLCHVYEKESAVRGHHMYKISWTLVIGEELMLKQKTATNMTNTLSLPLLLCAVHSSKLE